MKVKRDRQAEKARLANLDESPDGELPGPVALEEENV